MKQLDPNAPAYPAEVSFTDTGEIIGMQTGNTSGLSTGLTARQHACIQLELPESGVEWLDGLIRKKQLQTLAGQAMQATISTFSNHFNIEQPETVAEASVVHAKALLNELNKEV